MNTAQIIEIHGKLIKDLTDKKTDRQEAEAVALQTARILKAVRLQKDIVEMTGTSAPKSLLRFAGIAESLYQLKQALIPVEKI